MPMALTVVPEWGLAEAGENISFVKIGVLLFPIDQSSAPLLSGAPGCKSADRPASSRLLMEGDEFDIPLPPLAPPLLPDPLVGAQQVGPEYGALAVTLNETVNDSLFGLLKLSVRPVDVSPAENK